MSKVFRKEHTTFNIIIIIILTHFLLSGLFLVSIFILKKNKKKNQLEVHLPKAISLGIISLKWFNFSRSFMER